MLKNKPATRITFNKFTQSKKNVLEKLRGGYYTPKRITDFLVKWAVQQENAKVLEPSCGDGQFIESLVSEFGSSISITGIELAPNEALKASLRGNKKTNIITSDAFEWYIKSKSDKEFDAVIGNPPFIRYQNFPEEHKLKAFQLMREEGLSPSRLTNSWLPFVVLATKVLKPGGRIALVLPAELLQVSYAKELRKYLSSKYKDMTIITFKRLVFNNIQQEIILLLGERGDCSSASISFLEFNDLSDLEHKSFSHKNNNHKILDIDHDNEKWTQFYLSHRELGLIRHVERSGAFIRLGDIADVNVGIVTGRNNFFILSKEKSSSLGLLPYCSPIIGRSNHLFGILFTKSDYGLISKNGDGTLLFNPGNIIREELEPNLLSYIEQGENSGILSGYKCRIRLPNWWRIPSAWIPDAFLLRQIHKAPKIVANHTKATSTDTVHRVRMKSNIPAKLLAAAFINSLTFAFSEIKGRSYGGGVLELEPSEAENLLIPKLVKGFQLPIDNVDRFIRKKDTIGALDIVDSIVLKKAGLNKNEILSLRNIWLKLMKRRNSRNHASKKHNCSPVSS